MWLCECNCWLKTGCQTSRPADRQTISKPSQYVWYANQSTIMSNYTCLSRTLEQYREEEKQPRHLIVVLLRKATSEFRQDQQQCLYGCRMFAGKS